MLQIILCILLLVCIIGWLKYYISTLSLVYYLEIKQYESPSPEEMKTCTEYVVKKLFKVN